MPIKECKCKGGKSGHRWGNHGKCYCGEGSRKRAEAQAAAAHENGFREAHEMTKSAGSIDVLEERYLTEPSRVDRDKGIIHDVKFLGRVSKHGHTYSDNALRKAATLYEGLSIKVDHPDKKNPDVVRPIADTFGEARNCRFTLDGPVELQGVYGDLHYLKSHPMAETVCESAERMPNQLGLSHNAAALAATGPDGKVSIEDLEFVRSVDLVSKAATNKNIFESGESPMTTATVRNPAKNAKLRGRHALVNRIAALVGISALEDDSAVATDPAVSPAAVPAEIDEYEPDVGDAIKILVNAIMDADCDGAVKAKLVKLVTDLQEKIASAIDGETEEEVEESDDDTEEAGEGMESAPVRKPAKGAKTVLESAKPGKTAAVQAIPPTDPTILQVQESLAQMQRKQSTRDLLEEFKLPYEPGLVNALEAIGDDGKRRQLAESWPRQKMPVRAPRSGGRTAVLESEAEKPPKLPATKKELAAFLTGGQASAFSG